MALLPRLAGAGQSRRVLAQPLPGAPVRQVFAAARDGSMERPALTAVIDAIRNVSVG